MKLNHQQVLSFVETFLHQDAIDAIEKEFHSTTRSYSCNALNGYHLFQALDEYKTEIQTGGTGDTGLQKMINSLMKDEKITNEFVAELISRFLRYTYIEPTKQVTTLDHFFSTTLNIDVTSFSTNVQEMIPRSSKILLSSFGHDFPFVGREESVEQIQKCFDIYTDAVEHNQELDKKDIVIPFIAAAPGIGKSKLLKHIGMHYYEKKNYFPLFISFGNGFAYSSDEKIENSLSMRILFSFYCGLKQEHRRDFSMFRSNWISHFKNTEISVQTVLSFINAFLCKFLKTEENQRFILLLDEIHCIDTENNDNPLRSLVSIIGSYMQTPKFILLPLLAGSYYTVIHNNLLESMYVPCYIAMKPVLHEKDQIQLLSTLASTEKFAKLGKWIPQCEFRQYLRLLGGFPRGIEFFLQAFVRDEGVSPAASWSTAIDLLKMNYPFILRQGLIETVLTNLITRKITAREEIVLDNRTWSDLENQGNVMLQPYGETQGVIVYYPPILLSILLEKLQNKFISIIFKHTFEAPHEWQNWQYAIHTYAFLVFSFLKYQENKMFRDIFPFALMNVNTAQTPLTKIATQVDLLESLIKLEYDMETTQMAQKLFDQNGEIEKQTSVVDLDNGNRISVVKNLSDVLVFGLQTQQNEKLLIHYQRIWSDSQDNCITFNQINAEFDKNNKVRMINDTVVIPIRNVTVVFTNSLITNLDVLTLPDDLIIIYKENFDKFFGLFSEVMRCIL